MAILKTSYYLRCGKPSEIAVPFEQGTRVPYHDCWSKPNRGRQRRASAAKQSPLDTGVGRHRRHVKRSR